MPVSSSSIEVGRCFATSDNGVRKVLGIDGDSVTYVVRGRMAFPYWDTNAWRRASKVVFAREACSEVADNWHAAGAPTI